MKFILTAKPEEYFSQELMTWESLKLLYENVLLSRTLDFEDSDWSPARRMSIIHKEMRLLRREIQNHGKRNCDWMVIPDWLYIDFQSFHSNVIVKEKLQSIDMGMPEQKATLHAKFYYKKDKYLRMYVYKDGRYIWHAYGAGRISHPSVILMGCGSTNIFKQTSTGLMVNYDVVAKNHGKITCFF